jgi:DNA-binding NarL/FixJ family response regulator
VSDRPIKILLIDNDPIFCLGFSTALTSFDNLQIIAQVGSANDAIEYLSQELPDIVILEPAIEEGWSLARQIKQAYRDLPILLLSATSNSKQLLDAQAFGIEGYLPKGRAIDELVEVLRRLVARESLWQTIVPSNSDRALEKTIRRQSWLLRTGLSGLAQIEESLAQVNAHLDNAQLSLFDWLYWSGRRRELLTSRWIVSQLVPAEVILVPDTPLSGDRPISSLTLPVAPPSAGLLAIVPDSPATAFDNTIAKIQLGIENATGIPLEIDILQVEKRQELFYLVLDRFRKILEELRFLDVRREELPQKRSLVLRDLLDSSLLNFFSKYYTLIGLNNERVANILSQDSSLTQEEILDGIPFVIDILEYFLYQEFIKIDNVNYRFESPEAVNRAEMLLENLINGVANGVMQIILNNFSETEIIKQTLYQEKYLSSREIAQFRNDLSWKYRQNKYFEEPKNIFESKHRLFVLNGSRLKTIYIYGSRQEELIRLRGIPWLVTIAFELRDAVAPRFRAVIALVGNAAVYVLTNVIGRAIGLVGRGIVQGVGNSLQDTRYGKSKVQRTENRGQETGDRHS